MAEARAEQAVEGGAPEGWRRLSAWSVLHFAARAIAQSVQALVVVLPATYGAAQSPFAAYAWTIPVSVAAAITIGSVVSYVYYFFRVQGDAVEVKRGFLFKKHLNLSFARIQDIDLEDPFYFRPLGLVTLKLDSAGSASDEVNLAALGRPEAEALRAYILSRKRQLGGDERVLAAGSEPAVPASEVCFTRSVEDLIVHGLTNNRAYLAIAGVMGLIWQADLPVADAIAALGIDIDAIMASTTARLVLLFVIAFLVSGAVIACLSVLVAVIVYYGFTVYRSGDSLRIVRGLATRRETHVQKSRIQAVVVRQDWLERLIGRCNVILEQISHHPQQSRDGWQQLRQKILVPSVRTEEIGDLTDEVLEWRGIHDVAFTPISRRYFYKHAAIWSAVYGLALAIALPGPPPLPMFAVAVLVLWAAHIGALHLRWRRAGLAIDGGIVIARHGTIGVNYDVVPAFKIQNATHVQSVWMRRRAISTVVFRTAASRTKVPYLPADFAAAVVDYCVYTSESSDKSWM